MIPHIHKRIDEMFRAYNLPQTHEQLLTECLASKDVNYRQDIFMELKLRLSKPEMSSYLDSLIERYTKLQDEPDTEKRKNILSLLGFLYRYKNDFHSALPYINRAIDLGDANCMFLKGYIYDKGLGVPVNKATAIECYYMAKKLKHAGATFNYGILYGECYDQNGEPIPEIAKNNPSFFDEHKKKHGSDHLLKRSFKAAELGCTQAINAFNDMQRKSYLMHYSFLHNQSGTITPKIDQGVVLQEIQFMAVAGSGSGEGGPFTDSFQVKHTVKLPVIFSKLDAETKNKFLSLLEPSLKEIYCKHTETFQSLFKNVSPFEAEKEKMTFSKKTRYEAIRTATDRMSNLYLMGNADIHKIAEKIDRDYNSLKNIEKKYPRMG